MNVDVVAKRKLEGLTIGQSFKFSLCNNINSLYMITCVDYFDAWLWHIGKNRTQLIQSKLNSIKATLNLVLAFVIAVAALALVFGVLFCTFCGLYIRRKSKG